MREVRRQLIEGRCVWTGQEMESSDSWILHWPGAGVDEVDRALESVRSKGLRLGEFGRQDFAVPWFASKIESICTELEDGRGFVMLRGFPAGKYSVPDAELIFWGLGSHLGPAVSQNWRGELLSHVMDKGLEHGTREVRGYETRAKLFFHNDNGDAVGLFCLHEAKEGGASKLVSTAAIYNEILRRHPEYIDELCRGYYYHMRGEQPHGHPEVTEHRVPLFSYHAGKLSSRYTRNSILHGAEFLGKPLTGREKAPLDLVDALAGELCMTMHFKQGDMQLVSNHSVLHSRNEFTDFPEPERKRDLLRLWVNLPNGRPLTYEFATRYGPGSARRGVPPKPRLDGIQA
jgi:hypothetical protein